MQIFVNTDTLLEVFFCYNTTITNDSLYSSKLTASHTFKKKYK